VPLGVAASDLLESVEGIGALGDELRTSLASELCGLSLADGEILIRQGDGGGGLCVVVSGSLQVTWTDRTGAEWTLPDVAAGRVVGETSVLSDGPADATVRARGPVTLAEVPRAGLERFSARHPGGLLDLIEALRPLVHRHALRLALRRNDKFRDLDPALLADLETVLEPVGLYGGEVLLRRGDRSDDIYLIVSGRLRVAIAGSQGTEKVLAELGPGETIGEMALITGEPRSADVYAIRDTQLVKLSRPSVEHLLVRHPRSALLMLARGPVARVRNMSSGRSQVAPIATIAVVPAHPGVALTEFCERFSTGLTRLGPTLCVTSDMVDGRFGRAGAAQAFDRHGGNVRLLEWLAEQELQHRFVVYRSDLQCTPWTERSIRQADHVVIVADANAAPAPGEIESELMHGGASASTRRTLVLLHADGARPVNTARWLAGRTIERHLHVHLNDRRDFERVARVLTGKGVGLTLGGGFARGLTHLGVLRAIRELDLAIDALGGSSMGAMIGAQHLLGWDAQRIVREITEGMENALEDVTLPFLSLKRGGKYSRLIQTFFGDVQIEDLWLPFFCTSANLNRVALKVYDRGSLATALLATTRAPGLLPPLVIDGELHVDGGLINNVPVDVMKQVVNQGIVIGVDVSPPHHLEPVVDYGDDISGWQAMWHRFNPARGKRRYRPNILLVLMRLIEFGGISHRVRTADQADVYISPDVLRFKRSEFSAWAEMAEVGYTAAHEALTTWLAATAARSPDRVQ
jgi:predicted acylesterase/phospholipase RssA/CRP-like cAMP-binding protein